MTHGDLGVQILKTAELIGLNSLNAVHAVSINPSESPDHLREEIARAIKAVDTGDGVLILTDLFGGTPTNLSLTFLEDGKVDVVTGVNLPMIVRAVNSRDEHNLRSLALAVSESGKESIYLAGEVFRKRSSKKDARQ